MAIVFEMRSALALLILAQHLSVTSSNSQAVTSSSGAWCAPLDVAYDAYEVALDFADAAELGEPELDRVIEAVFVRAGCRHLLNSSESDLSCSNCLNASDIYNVLDLPAFSLLPPSLFDNASTIIASFLDDVPGRCSAAAAMDWNSVTYEYFQHQLLHLDSVIEHLTNGNKGKVVHLDPAAKNVTNQKNGLLVDDGDDHGHGDYLQVDQLEWLMRRISENYLPGNDLLLNLSEESRQRYVETTCSFWDIRSFSSEDVEELTEPESPDEGIHADELGSMSAVLITKLLIGECISRTDSEVGVTGDSFLVSLYQSYEATTGSCLLSTHALEEIAASMNIGSVSADSHAANSLKSGETVARRGTGNYGVEKLDPYHDHDHDHGVDVNATCFSVAEILKSFNLDTMNSLAKTDFMRLCPALVQQATQGCRNVAHQHTTENRPSDAESYGYGTLSVLIISSCCFFGLIIVRWQGKPAYKHIMSVMLGLGIGSLVGDALLHLVPQALGLHDHAADGGDPGHSHSNEGKGLVIPLSTWKLLCACGGIWFYYVLQLLLYRLGTVLENRKVQKVSSAQMSVDFQANDAFHASASSDTCDSFTNDLKDRELEEEVKKNVDNLESGEECRAEKSKQCSHSSFQLKEPAEDLEIPHAHFSVAWMVTVGDGFHNFTDGLAIGAAFSSSWQTGLATSIAIFAHELPHEFGDTAVLLSAGWKWKKVLIFQLLSQSTAFIGLYIGIGVSQYSASADQWIFAVACGLFLYVALADIIPELIESFAHSSQPWIIFIGSNVGIFIGFTAMLVLAIFEDQIKVG